MSHRRRSVGSRNVGVALIVLVVIIVLVIVFGASRFTMPPPVSTNSIPPVTVTSPVVLQDGPAREGWDAFWAQFKVWLEELALVFAQMPLIGPLLASILNFIGATNVWFCGAVLFILVLLGAFAIRR